MYFVTGTIFCWHNKELGYFCSILSNVNLLSCLSSWSLGQKERFPFLSLFLFSLPFKFNSLTLFLSVNNDQTGPQGPNADHLIVLCPLLHEKEERECLSLSNPLSFPSLFFSGTKFFNFILIFDKFLSHFLSLAWKLFSLSHPRHISYSWNMAEHNIILKSVFLTLSFLKRLKEKKIESR